MAISGVAAQAAYQTPVVQKTNDSNTAAASTAVAQKAPQKLQSDTVAISTQAQKLLANSKTYTPAEEAVETGAEKSFEATKGQR